MFAFMSIAFLLTQSFTELLRALAQEYKHAHITVMALIPVSV